MKVFGLEQLSNQVAEKLKVKVKNKYTPENWSWKPTKPEKIAKIVEEVSREKQEVDYTVITNYKPGNEEQKIVLVFSMGNLSYSIVKNLEKQNLKYFFIDFVQFMVKGTVEYKFNKKDVSVIWEIDDVKLDLKDVKVVLWNPPKYPAVLHEYDMIPRGDDKRRQKYLFNKRWTEVLREMSDMVAKDCVWLPGDINTGWQGHQQKLNEYAIFTSEGLNVPPTIFTNSKAKVLDFVKEHGPRILLREFCCPPYSFPPVEIEIDGNSLENIEASPCTFQKYIEKVYEFRVVILSGKIWACRIDSQSSELAKNDWRVHDDANVKWDIVNLPNDIEKSLLNIVKRMKLNWASADLILDTEGNYYILEINRPGAHYWLDLFVGLDIGEELVKTISDHIESV